MINKAVASSNSNTDTSNYDINNNTDKNTNTNANECADKVDSKKENQEKHDKYSFENMHHFFMEFS